MTLYCFWFHTKDLELTDLLKDKAHQILGINAGATAETVESAKQCCSLWCLGRGDELGRLMSLKAASFLQEEDKRSSLRGRDERQLDVCKELARSSNFGADEVAVESDPMPELVKCRMRVGEALRDNNHQLDELEELKVGLSKQEGHICDSAAVLSALPTTIQLLWGEVETAIPGPTTLCKLTDLLDAFQEKSSLTSKDGEFVLPSSDANAAWVVNLARLSQPEKLSEKLREHMLTPLHASLTVIEPMASLKAAKLCDSFLAAVCKTEANPWYAQVESYLQESASRQTVQVAIVNEYIEQAEGSLLLDAAQLARHACMWMGVDYGVCSFHEASRQLAKHHRMLQLLDFDDQESAVAAADLARSTFDVAVSMLNQSSQEPLIQDADPASLHGTLPAQDDDEEEYESIDCDRPPSGWQEVSAGESSASKASSPSRQLFIGPNRPKPAPW